MSNHEDLIIALRSDLEEEWIKCGDLREAIEILKDNVDSFRADRDSMQRRAEAAETAMASTRAELAGSQALCAKMREYTQQASEAFHRASELGCSCYSDPEGSCDHCTEWEHADFIVEKALAASPYEALAGMLKAGFFEGMSFDLADVPLKEKVLERRWANSETFRRLAGGGAK